MTPTNIETSTDARSKSRVELAPTMPCKEEEGDIQMIQKQINYGKE